MEVPLEPQANRTQALELQQLSGSFHRDGAFAVRSVRLDP